MKRNMGNADRIIRSFIAVVIIGLSFSGIIHGPLGWLLLVMSVIFILTSIFGVCPLYTLLGIKTYAMKNKAG